MPSSKIELLGWKIQYHIAELQNTLEDKSSINSRRLLLDAIDDLRAELLEPAEWYSSFLDPIDFSALQVAFRRDVFQNVPLRSPVAAEGVTIPSIHVKNLATLVKMDEDRLLRIMRLLEVNRIFTEVQEKHFAHTPLSAGMAGESVAATLRGQLSLLFKACSSLADSIENGDPDAWVTRFGMRLFEYLEKSGGKGRSLFAESMANNSREVMSQISTIFPWETVHKVVDVGGGNGHLAASLAQEYGHLELINQDLPMVIEDAMSRVASLAPKEKAAYDRVKFETHNYYDPQPRSGMNAFIFRRCFHNNTDSECKKILRAAIPGLENGGYGASLLIIEKLLPAWSAEKSLYKAKRLRKGDVCMMISCGGKERTLEEYRALMTEADGRLTVDQVYHGENDVAVITAKLSSTLPVTNGV